MIAPILEAAVLTNAKRLIEKNGLSQGMFRRNNAYGVYSAISVGAKRFNLNHRECIEVFKTEYLKGENLIKWNDNNPKEIIISELQKAIDYFNGKL